MPHSCATKTTSIAYEIGHILGARQDRAFDPRNTPFAYGHAYVNGKWRDIMSYQQSCDGCVGNPYWSNPRVMYKGEPTGTATEDNAHVILKQADRVRNSDDRERVACVQPRGTATIYATESP